MVANSQRDPAKSMMYEQHEQTSAPNSVAGGGVHAATALSTSPARQAKMRLDQVVDDARALRADVDSLLYQTGARERADLGKEDRLIAIEEKSTQMTKDLTEVNSRLEFFLGAAKKVDEQMASQQEQLDLMREEIMRMRAKKSASLRDIPSGAFEARDAPPGDHHRAHPDGRDRACARPRHGERRRHLYQVGLVREVRDDAGLPHWVALLP
jgi:hypothetical protein